MSASLTDQLECSKAVLEKMRSNKSRWLEAQEGVVKTVERALALEEVSNEITGRKTEQVEIQS